MFSSIQDGLYISGVLFSEHLSNDASEYLQYPSKKQTN